MGLRCTECGRAEAPQTKSESHFGGVEFFQQTTTKGRQLTTFQGCDTVNVCTVIQAMWHFKMVLFVLLQKESRDDFAKQFLNEFHLQLSYFLRFFHSGSGSMK